MTDTAIFGKLITEQAIMKCSAMTEPSMATICWLEYSLSRGDELIKPSTQTYRASSH